MPPPPTTTPTPALPEDILEEIFLRLPPDEPACLVRASLASKLWLSLLSGPSFRGRYRNFHGSPPMLGFVHSPPHVSGSGPIFVSTSKFVAREIPDDRELVVLDCRHGRVLLWDNGVTPRELFVWDPMTGCRRYLCPPNDDDDCYDLAAAVLCVVTGCGCDHRACHEGPFRVVFVGLSKSNGCVASAYMSSPEVGEWSKQCPSHLHLLNEWSDPCSRQLHLGTAGHHPLIEPMPPVLIEGALYFMLWYHYDYHVEILKCDVGSNCLLSLLDATPLPRVDLHSAAILMAMEDGSLGFALAHQDGSTLNLWSTPVGSHGLATWTPRRAIDLKELLPHPKLALRMVGSVEGSDTIFVIVDLGIYEINLKSLRWKKTGERDGLCTLIPYMSFYNPRVTVKNLRLQR